MSRKAPFGLRSSGSLSGRIQVPGDKSISHRALMLGALCVGETRISGLLEGEDVLATAAALRAMGVRIEPADGIWRVRGVGAGGLLEPDAALDLGNSGTSARLLMGLLTPCPIRAVMTGDASLSRRPMERVTGPLSMMGAVFDSAEGCLPLVMRGSESAIPIDYTLPVASAQVKSAVLLAGVGTAGRTTVREPSPTRDHSERMLAGFGADISVREEGGLRVIEITGERELTPQAIAVPGDISSAAFPLVAAAIVPGSEVSALGVGLNPTRTGILEALRLLGADIEAHEGEACGGEPAGDIRVRACALTGTEIPAALAPLMIDEYPILMIAAALAEGTTVMRGLAELRIKESDRLQVMADGLRAAGVETQLMSDGIVIEGTGGRDVPGGAEISSRLDHRIAMSFAVLGLRSRQPLAVDDGAPVATSFPNFLGVMKALGAESL